MKGEVAGSGGCWLLSFLRLMGVLSLGMRLCSAREHRRGGEWDWRGGGRRLIGRGDSREEEGGDRRIGSMMGSLKWVGLGHGGKYGTG